MTIRIQALCYFLLLATGLASASEFPQADQVVIDKSDRVLHLVENGKIFKTFKIALGIRPGW